jgi:hypothetical protein
MEKAFASVKLPWIYRKAVGFLNYLQVAPPPWGARPRLVSRESPQFFCAVKEI